jgi:N-acetylglucosaminyldiphosphoundecaprenol N-acetyl-beta-D-mannosaminyltransferase
MTHPTAAARPAALPSFPMLGTRVHAMTYDDLYAGVASAVREGRRIVVASHNMHSVALHRSDPVLREFYRRADYSYVDGMPLIWIGQLIGWPLRREHRIASLDHLRPLLRRAATEGWRCYVVGGRPGVAERATARLRAEIPGLWFGAEHGYFDTAPGSAETEAVLARIAEIRPQLLFVGMGMPRQEHWIARNLDRLPVNFVTNMGATMDYIAGEIPTAPRWMGRLGLEWLFRLWAEPRRLAHRYLVEPATLVPALAADVVRYRLRPGAGRTP